MIIILFVNCRTMDPTTDGIANRIASSTQKECDSTTQKQCDSSLLSCSPPPPPPFSFSTAPPHWIELTEKKQFSRLLYTNPVCFLSCACCNDHDDFEAVHTIGNASQSQDEEEKEEEEEERFIHPNKNTTGTTATTIRITAATM